MIRRDNDTTLQTEEDDKLNFGTMQTFIRSEDLSDERSGELPFEGLSSSDDLEDDFSIFKSYDGYKFSENVEKLIHDNINYECREFK